MAAALHAIKIRGKTVMNEIKNKKLCSERDREKNHLKVKKDLLIRLYLRLALSWGDKFCFKATTYLIINEVNPATTLVCG